MNYKFFFNYKMSSNINVRQLIYVCFALVFFLNMYKSADYKNIIGNERTTLRQTFLQLTLIETIKKKNFPIMLLRTNKIKTKRINKKEKTKKLSLYL